jgi:hypothetical protein
LHEEYLEKDRYRVSGIRLAELTLAKEQVEAVLSKLEPAWAPSAEAEEAKP